MFEDDLDSVADALDVMMPRATFEAPKTDGRPPEEPSVRSKAHPRGAPDLTRGFSVPHASSAVPCGDCVPHLTTGHLGDW
jgi:hypothetical protein